jgi:signal recognition particle subunit SRP54
MGGGMGGGMGGHLPPPTPEQIEALQKQMGGQLPPFPGAPGGGGKGPALPGLGGPKIPGLPGLGLPFGGKKK